MNIYERFVCNEYLSSYPKHLSFEDVIELLYSLNDEVEVWEPFDELDAHGLVDCMTNMLSHLREQFVPREEYKQ
jgi:hypothetical protein